MRLRRREPPSRAAEQIRRINEHRIDLDAYAAQNLASRERVEWTPGASGPCGICGHPQDLHADDRTAAEGGRMMLAYYDGWCIVPGCHLCDSTGYVPSRPAR